MSKYVIPGHYNERTAIFIYRNLMSKAIEVFNLKKSGIYISVVPVDCGANTIEMFTWYNIIVNANDCISDDTLKTWVTQTIVDGYFNSEVN